jgi:hypothetical protein
VGGERAVGPEVAFVEGQQVAGGVPGRIRAARRNGTPPVNAGLAIEATTGLRQLPISSRGGLGVMAAWVAAAFVTAGLLLRLGDA